MSGIDLKTELNRWYEEHCIRGSQTWGTLATRSSVSVSQISKIANGQVIRPKYKTAKALIEAVHPKDSSFIDQFLSEKFPKVHQKSDKTEQSEPHRDIDLMQLRVLLKDQLTYRLVQMAAAKAYSADELISQFGAGRVTRRIDVLVEIGAVRMDDSGTISTTRAYDRIEHDDLTSIAQDFLVGVDIVATKTQVQSLSLDPAQDDSNQLLPFSGNLSSEAVAEMSREARDFMRAMEEKYSAPEYQGDIPAFLHLSSGRLDNK